MTDFPPSENARLIRHAPRKLQHPLDWAAENIDYSRAPCYDTPFKGRFDPGIFPFWRDPLSWSIDPNIREIVVRKCSRAGGSETFLLTRLRWGIVNRPEPSLYMGADVESVKSFMEDRVKRGMDLAELTQALYRQARITEHAIRFPAMDFRIKWARQKSAYKQDGYALIECDEFSTWPAFAADMIRKRADMYEFHHILFISSPDPARKGNPETDPIIVLESETDRCQWFMDDPGKKGASFFWQFGGADVGYGLKWPQAARRGDEWDLDQVRRETVYITPGGYTITNDERIDISASGRWTPTAMAKRDDVRGITITAPMIPTASGDFGELAARFLSAKYRLRIDGTKEERQHNPIRVYFAEYWAEAHREEQMQVSDDTLSHCEGEYGWKQISVQPDSNYGVACTVDVQKYHLWWLGRVWEVRKSGAISSHLLDYGNSATFTDLDSSLAELEPRFVGIDIGYQLRQSEVADYCAEYTDQMHPRDSAVLALRGSDTLTKSIMDMVVNDAYEGRRMTGQNLYCEITWSVDVFRSWLLELLDSDGEKWTVPKGIGMDKKGMEYLRQVTSTRKADGIWIPPKHGHDHLFDCETMQLVIARHDRLIQ